MSFLTSVIPGWHRKFTSAADHNFYEEGPRALRVVGIRINDVTSGGSLSLTLGDQSITYDNLSEGEVLTGEWGGSLASGSNVDSFHVFYR